MRGTVCTVFLCLIAVNPLTSQTISLDDLVGENREYGKTVPSPTDETTGLADRGISDFKSKKYLEASTLLVQALSRFPDPNWFYTLGDALYELKDFAHSALAYQKSADYQLDRQDLAYYNAACSFSLSGDKGIPTKTSWTEIPISTPSVKSVTFKT